MCGHLAWPIASADLLDGVDHLCLATARASVRNWASDAWTTAPGVAYAAWIGEAATVPLIGTFADFLAQAPPNVTRQWAQFTALARRDREIRARQHLTAYPLPLGSRGLVAVVSCWAESTKAQLLADDLSLDPRWRGWLTTVRAGYDTWIGRGRTTAEWVTHWARSEGVLIMSRILIARGLPAGPATVRHLIHEAAGIEGTRPARAGLVEACLFGRVEGETIVFDGPAELTTASPLLLANDSTQRATHAAANRLGNWCRRWLLAPEPLTDQRMVGQRSGRRGGRAHANLGDPHDYVAQATSPVALRRLWDECRHLPSMRWEARISAYLNTVQHRVSMARRRANLTTKPPPGWRQIATALILAYFDAEDSLGSGQ